MRTHQIFIGRRRARQQTPFSISSSYAAAAPAASPILINHRRRFEINLARKGVDGVD
jgi:hypothetical protein